MAANEVGFAVEAIESPPVGVESEYECHLMIEALSRELTAVKVMLHVVGPLCVFEPWTPLHVGPFGLPHSSSVH